MAWGNFVYDSGFQAAAQIVKFRCVKMTAAEVVGPVSGITDVAIGVAQFGVTTAELAKGKLASVRVIGVSEVEAAGAIAVGARCQVEADGRVSAEVGSSGKRLVGICVGAPSTNAGDRVAMLVLVGLGLA